MAGDYWEQAIYVEPPLGGLDRSDAAAAFSWLDLNFSTDGTKIDWRRVHGRHMHWKIDDVVQLASTASREVCQRIRPGSGVEHVGDGLSPYGVCFTSDNAEPVVAALLDIPEHHYFLARDRSWIVVVTAEGDLDVVELLPRVVGEEERLAQDEAEDRVVVDREEQLARAGVAGGDDAQVLVVGGHAR